MDMILFLGLFIMLGAVYIAIGYAASRHIKTVDDYFLAGRDIGLFAITIALMATQLGGGVILGTSRESYTNGLWGLAYVVGIVSGFILLASGIASRMRALGVATTAEIFTLRYHSPLLKKIASLLFILSLSGLLTAQVVASRNLMISLNVYSDPLFYAFWLLVIGYTIMGGLRAIVHNDVFQLIFIVAVFTILFLYELFTQPYAIITTFREMSITGSTKWDVSRLLAIILMPTCFSLIEQDIAQTLFAAKTPRIALKGSLLAGICMLFFAIIPLYFGMKAKLMGIHLDVAGNPILSLFDQEYPSIVVILIAYGIFAAIISTADALLCAISSHVVRDFELSTGKNRTLILSKATTCVVGILTLIAGRYLTNIIDVIVDSYTIPVSTLFVPIIIAYFSKKPSLWGAYASCIAGGSMLILCTTCRSLVYIPELSTLMVSAIAYVLASYAEHLYAKKTGLLKQL